MKQLLSFAVSFTIGYLVVNKLAPAVIARVESLDLDTMWDVYDDVWSGQ
jgi:hypothetical protein